MENAKTSFMPGGPSARFLHFLTFEKLLLFMVLYLIPDVPDQVQTINKESLKQSTEWDTLSVITSQTLTSAAGLLGHGPRPWTKMP